MGGCMNTQAGISKAKSMKPKINFRGNGPVPYTPSGIYLIHIGLARYLGGVLKKNRVR